MTGAPAPAPSTSPAAPAKKGMGRGAKVGLVGGGLLALMVACSVAVAGSGAETNDAPTTTASDEQPAEPVATAEPAAEEPAAEEPATEEPIADEPVVEEEPAAAGIGTPVRDGKFEFTVNGMECGIDKVGSEYLNKDAQGQFCLVDVTVLNIGDQAQTFFGDNTYVYNAEGQRYSADSGAAIYIDSNSWMTEINPGNTMTGKVVFDVPAGVTPVRIELHDSMFSGGVEVQLG